MCVMSSQYLLFAFASRSWMKQYRTLRDCKCLIPHVTSGVDLALVVVYFMFRPLFRFFSHQPNAPHEKDRKKKKRNRSDGYSPSYKEDGVKKNPGLRT